MCQKRHEIDFDVEGFEALPTTHGWSVLRSPGRLSEMEVRELPTFIVFKAAGPDAAPNRVVMSCRSLG